MRVYAFDAGGLFLLLKTDDQTAARPDNGELAMDDVLFTARLFDPADLFDSDEDGNPLFSITM